MTTSIGRFAVDREFVNIENASQDCAQDHQEDPEGTILGQDGAQDRQEDPKGDYWAKTLIFLRFFKIRSQKHWFSLGFLKVRAKNGSRIP